MSSTRIPVPKYFLPFFGFVAAIIPFSIDAYLPAFPTMALEFGVDETVIGQSISTFFIGFGLGQLLGGPMSDQLGRKTVSIPGMFVFMLCTIAIVWTESLEMLKVWRFFQALGAGFAAVNVMASLRDAYPAHEAGRKYSLAMMIMLVMPIIAPIIGAQMLPYGWRSIFVILFIFTAIMGLVYYFGIPETAAHRTGRLDLTKMMKQYRAVFDVRNHEGMRAIRYTLVPTFNVGIILAFVTNASFIYQSYFEVSEQVFPYFFGANTVLMIACISYSIRQMKLKHPHGLFIWGNALCLISATLLGLYVLLGSPELMPTAALIICTIGFMGLVNPCASALYIAQYDELSGSATSINRCFVLIAGGFFGWLVGHLTEGSLLPFCAIVFGLSLVANIIGWTMPRPTTSFNPK